MEGKLTAEWRKANPDVEPASELLARIETEKAALVKAKQIKKSKPLPPVSEEEMPFELPEGWVWLRLGEFTHNFGQKKPEDDFSYIDVGTIDNKIGRISNDVAVVPSEEAPSRARKIIRKGCVLYSTVRPYLMNIVVVDQEFTPEPIASTAFAVLNPFCKISPEYLFYSLRSNFFNAYVESKMKGVAYPAINDKKLMNAPIPLPPLPEQQAIVQTVDALLQELDRLQQRTETRLQLKADYATAALRRLTTAPAVGPAWEALAPHFRTFFDETGNVQALRAAILQLAVQGKLTAHWRKAHPDVEPATELLSRIQAEKAALVKAKKIKKEKPLPPVDMDEVPFGVPEGWVWCRMINIFRFIDYRGKTPKKISEGIRLLTAKNVRPGFLKLEPEEFMSEEEYINWMTRGFPRKGDLLFTTEAPLGNVCQLSLDEKVGLAQRIITLQPYITEIQNKFLMYSIMSDGIQESIKQKATGMTARGIKASKLKRLIIPLPPLPEQHAIVQAVEELLGLCTALEEAAGRRDVVLGDWVRAVVAGG
ncbi:restriction endonuclease subunit S [Phaeodactylibacter xiamenensis]|uniref:restriction endonuclease subunit S n=1 Tax=Phaeodactylibacter xiamenensis TaxID=1524460 RepID=UPI003BABF29F